MFWSIRHLRTRGERGAARCRAYGNWLNEISLDGRKNSREQKRVRQFQQWVPVRAGSSGECFKEPRWCWIRSSDSLEKSDSLKKVLTELYEREEGRTEWHIACWDEDIKIQKGEKSAKTQDKKKIMKQKQREKRMKKSRSGEKDKIKEINKNRCMRPFQVFSKSLSSETVEISHISENFCENKRVIPRTYSNTNGFFSYCNL